MSTLPKVLQLVNKLQQICAKFNENAVTTGGGLPGLWDLLPAIVVVGGQSSGKSSVLEAIVGRDFLPRGQGIVTRRPLILQLEHLADPGAREYGEFQHLKTGEQFYDFHEIMREIEDETQRHIAKVKKMVDAAPIHLRIASPKVPNLTLIDMPGLTKIAIDGQPESIIKEIEDMVLQYIQGQNTIILAVSPANADLATSDALNIARRVDPAGERTIGALTKVDIMDRGTSARNVLMGKEVSLRMGWVAVVNRAQADLNARMDMNEARRREREFFQQNPAYRDLENIGTETLSRKLSEVLERTIQREIPNIQRTIDENIGKLEKQIEDLGGPTLESRGDMAHEVVMICQAFQRGYAEWIDGGEGGGVKILEIFEGPLAKEIMNTASKTLALDYVNEITSQADGYQRYLIAPEQGYRELIKLRVKELHHPAQRAVESTHGVLSELVQRSVRAEFAKGLAKYRNLRAELEAVAQKSLQEFRSEAAKYVSILVDMEGAYPTVEPFRDMTAGQDMQSMRGPDGNVLPTQPPAHLDSRQRELWTIAQRVSVYLKVVANQLAATIPKAIVHHQVVKAKERLLDRLIKEVHGKDEDDLRRLLAEDEATATRRLECQKRLQLMRKARQEIAHFTGW